MARRKERGKKGSWAGSEEPAHAGQCRLGSLKSGLWDFPDSSIGKESACNAGDTGSIPGSGRYPGEGIGYPLQYSGLENPMDCTVCGVAKSQTQLSDFDFHLHRPQVSLHNPLMSRVFFLHKWLIHHS